MGLFTLEELHYSPEGSLHTRGPSTYKIPAFGSIPTNFRVSLLRDCPNRKAIYASKVLLPWVWLPSCLHRGNPRVGTGPSPVGLHRAHKEQRPWLWWWWRRGRWSGLRARELG